MWSIRSLAAAGVVAGVVLVATVGVLDRSPAIGIAVGAVVLLLGVGHAVLRFRAFRYAVTDDTLRIERGVLTQVRTVVPHVRVQHVDTQRRPIERAVGLSRVVVYTAGSRGADVSIPGLSPDRAIGLQDRLRSLAVESEPDDAV